MINWDYGSSLRNSKNASFLPELYRKFNSSPEKEIFFYAELAYKNIKINKGKIAKNGGDVEATTKSETRRTSKKRKMDRRVSTFGNLYKEGKDLYVRTFNLQIATQILEYEDLHSGEESGEEDGVAFKKRFKPSFRSRFPRVESLINHLHVNTG